MENIFKAMIELIENNKEVEVIFPMHKNPSIRELAYRYFDTYKEKVHLIEPLEYVEFANLMSKVYLIMTDSGGIQEEAPALGKPVIVLRTETERPEAIKAGTAKLSGIEKDNIIDVANELIRNESSYQVMAQTINPYGNGMSCENIINILVGVFNE